MRGAGAYPGSFNPLTVAHLAIAEAAVRQCGLERVDLVLSRVALGKERVQHPPLQDRLAVLEAAASTRPWLGAVVTDRQLLADIAEGYDVVVLGADKWTQLLDPAYYGGSPAARDAAVAKLPRVAVAPRPAAPAALPPGAVVLEVDAWIARVSATAARAGRHDWMAPEAAAHGAWDPTREPRGREGGASAGLRAP